MTGLGLLCALLLASCGDSEHERSSRFALAPLAQRNLSLSEEIVLSTSQDHAEDSPSEQLLRRHAAFVAEKQQVAEALRDVVITPRYECVTRLVSRSAVSDAALLAARYQFLEHLREASAAAKDAAYWMARRADGAVSPATAALMLEDPERRRKQALARAADARLQANAAATEALAVAETLAVALKVSGVLPVVYDPAYLFLDELGADSIVRGDPDQVYEPCPNGARPTRRSSQ